MNKKHVVRLESQEREELQKLVSKGKAAARKLTHAHILLQSDVAEGRPGRTDEQIAEALGVTTRTVEHVRRRCVEEGLETALERKKREGSPTPRILDGAKEAKLVALCCSEAPKGRKRWTLRLLADRLVELNIVESISRYTVHRVMKKKRAQALAQKDVVHSTRAERRVRMRHGKRAGCLPSALRREPAGGVHG